jgi:hypothetical protein
MIVEECEMLVQQYLPEILDLVQASTTEAICQQIGMCTAAETTQHRAAGVASTLRNNDDTISAAQEELIPSGCAAPCVLQAVRLNCTEAACAAAVCRYILHKYMTQAQRVGTHMKKHGKP